jgi:iron-sulfur cluster assembly protein
MHDFKPITISPRALEEIRKIMDKKGIPADYGLRVGVRGGGCGVSLIIGFDKKKDTDLAYTLGGIPVYVARKDTLFLIGKEVDFYEGSEGRGFTFVDSPVPARTPEN